VLDTAVRQAHLDQGSTELHSAITALKDHAESLRDAEKLTPQLTLALFEHNRPELEELLVRVVENSTERLDSETLRHLSLWIERTRHHLFNIRRDLETLTPWALTLASAPAMLDEPDQAPEMATLWAELQTVLALRPTLEEIPAVCSAGLAALSALRAGFAPANAGALTWCDSLDQSLRSAGAAAEGLLAELEQISQRAEAWFDGMNFAFLFDPDRQVFHIGYNVDTGRQDPNYYDLLASEARLTSLVAIAKGDVPQSHWLSMSRPITQAGSERVLLSWSGTMFEYLMPTLLARSYPGTLLEQSCRAAVERQVEYARSRGVPWGISESSYYYFDSNQVYQYRAFGIPDLGYKRGLGEDLVITPYASLLALPFAPIDVALNLEQLEKMGMLGAYGLYEAADFTAARLATGRNYAVVRSYMAHHQGMILLSLGNYLNGEAMVRRFHADPRINTVQLLLQEQTPHRAPLEYPHPHEIGRLHLIHSEVSLDPWRARNGAAHPQIHFLSNGNYGVLISASGGGFSRWGGIDLTRWRSDPTLDNHGSWLYVRDQESGRLWSATLQPTGIQPDTQSVRFYPHAAEFVRRDGDLTLRTRLSVLPDADVEIRRVTISNHGSSPRRLSLTSYGEVILNAQAVDQRHPPSTSSSSVMPRARHLLFRRHTFGPGKPVYLAHFTINARDDLKVTGYETDRAASSGAGGRSRAPRPQPDSGGTR
jgi:cyclic beta-1,2-glucan synthetase